ncbi:MAG: PH domain-containing protein [Maribacter sp.]|nr:PH domain-containing protein [Maribacter sp.]
MKFKSRKDILFSTILLGVPFFVLGLTADGIIKGEMTKGEYWVLPLVIIIVGYILWFYYGTNYELNKDGFVYRSGPINGKINPNRIKEIVKGKTLWMGFRPATARKGLIIKYDQFGEIYISPKTNEAFIEQILVINRNIKITE